MSQTEEPFFAALPCVNDGPIANSGATLIVLSMRTHADRIKLGVEISHGGTLALAALRFNTVFMYNLLINSAYI